MSRPRAHRRRFRELLDANYFDGCRFHRYVSDFIVQWGIPADPNLHAQFGDNKIRDDPVLQSNKAGTVSFATSGPNARGSQMFINLNDNGSLDGQGYRTPDRPPEHPPPPRRATRLTPPRLSHSFAPFAEIDAAGLKVAAQLSNQYERSGPDQSMAKKEGNAYLAAKFPELSYIDRVTIV